MFRKLLFAIIALELAGGVVAFGTPAQAQAVKAGIMTCNVAGGFGFIFGSSRAVNCTFTPDGVAPQHYVGAINKFGVDIGYPGGRSGSSAKTRAVHPSNAAIFTDLDPAGGVPLGLPAGVLGKGEEHGGSGSRWFQSTFVRLPTALAVRYWNMARQRYYRPSARCCRVRRVSADRAARPGPHTRGKPRLLNLGTRIPARDRFAPDSPLEETVSSEPVSEAGSCRWPADPGGPGL